MNWIDRHITKEIQNQYKTCDAQYQELLEQAVGIAMRVSRLLHNGDTLDADPQLIDDWNKWSVSYSNLFESAGLPSYM